MIDDRARGGAGDGAEAPAGEGPGPGAAERPPVVCRKLRTKVAFGSMHPGLRDWRYGASSTAVYWCLATLETAGPDDGYAHPHCCCAGRSCFVAPADDGADERAPIA
ncbi:uncharacterized protein SOCEGT47_001480 [Sorangium cellulosum]|uniref:Uncharacterized protein n=1 Tax=Sorangium cellulosum TaxID=56 RepID=A0A4P2PTH5_SORCE|nr:hypothetical protein [Sorangium cellulosum]AUX19696.1 uncharacterized protein SOCEGT47_001480 [Sorangium cellulosum]